MACPRGPRLNFRDFLAGDISVVHEYASDPEVTRWSTWGPNTLEQTTAFIEDAAQAYFKEARAAFSLAAVLGAKVIGSVDIWVTDPHDRNGELGYTFQRDCWGNGYASEAVTYATNIRLPHDPTRAHQRHFPPWQYRFNSSIGKEWLHLGGAATFPPMGTGSSSRLAAPLHFVRRAPERDRQNDSC